MNILAVAHALPTRLVTNDDLIERVAARNRASASAPRLTEICGFLRAQLARTGASTRYPRSAGETALDLGTAAARRALDRAGLQPDAVDLLIFTGVGRGFVEPATANIFQHELGLVRATCFDILDACAGWLRALDVAHHLIAAGAYRCAMVLNCEANFPEYEPAAIGSREDLKLLWSGYTVGEAATATILGPNVRDDGYRITFRNAGVHALDCQIALPHATQFLNGHGPRGLVPLQFRARPEVLASGAIRRLHAQYWSDAVLPRLPYDIVFGHSVSVPVSQAVLRRLDLDPGRYYEIFPVYGNVVSASLPLALSLAQADGRLQHGQRVLLIMGGAGLTTALATFVY